MITMQDAGKYQLYEFEGEGGLSLGEFLLVASNDAGNLVELRGFEIYPQYRKKGLSYGMLADAINAARTYKFTNMSLKVKKDNAAAIALYTNAGFTIKHNDHQRSELTMEIEL